MEQDVIDGLPQLEEQLTWNDIIDVFQYDAIGGTIDLNDIKSLSIKLGVKGNNGINDIEQDAIDGLPQLEEIVGNDITNVFQFSQESKETMELIEFY